MAPSQPASKRSGFTIDVGCPGCGADIELDDDFFLAVCTSCGSVLRIVRPDQPPAFFVTTRLSRRELRFKLDRALKEAGERLTSSSLQIKHLLYPYWRIKAVVLKLRNTREQRTAMVVSSEQPDVEYDVDTTSIWLSPHETTVAAAAPLAGVPASIGMRSAILPIAPLTSDRVEGDYDLLPVVVSSEEAEAAAARSIGVMGMMSHGDFGQNRTEWFHPEVDLVYFPYVVIETYDSNGVRRFVQDGVSGRLLKEPIANDVSSTETPSEIAMTFGSLGLSFHRCDNCGVDLPDNHSYFYSCANCGRVDIAEQAIAVNASLAAGSAPGSLLVPFWAFDLGRSQEQELQRLFTSTTPPRELLIPAFRVERFEQVYKLAHRMTVAGGRFDWVDADASSLAGYRLAPVTLTLPSALSLADVVIFRTRIGRDPNAEVCDRWFRPDDVSLRFIPFKLEHYFYVDAMLSAVTFEKQLIDSPV